MKFIHLSDLHLGKKVNEYSMIDDQKYILQAILKIAYSEEPDAVIIAGDVYDKPVPPAEAVPLFDDFLFKLSEMNIKVFVISGNHDSAERIAFGSRLMNKSGIYMSPVYDGDPRPVTLEDEYGRINIYMLPFIKPAHVRRFNEDAEITSYTDALKTAIDKLNINTDERNVLITHQFVTGADRTESEDISVGGSDNVDVSVFEPFDYTALGHIHRAQKCTRENVRYCGTPLKYSFSEANDKKSVTIAELGRKGELVLRTSELVPLHDMCEIKGKYNDIMLRSFYENTSYRTDYMHITLTDEDDIPDAVGKLRTVYQNLMKLDYDNERTKRSVRIETPEQSEATSPRDHFASFYEQQNNRLMTEQQSEFINELIEDIWGNE